ERRALSRSDHRPHRRCDEGTAAVRRSRDRVRRREVPRTCRSTMLRLRRRWRGFSLAEVLVTVTIIAILAATVIPTIKERMRTGYANSIAGELGNLAQAIQNYKSTVGRYPLRLDYLDALPVTASDICTNPLLTPQRNGYVGPYITRVILPSTSWYTIADDDSV